MFRNSPAFALLLLIPVIAIQWLGGCSSSDSPSLISLERSEDISYSPMFNPDEDLYLPGEVLVVLNDTIETGQGSDFFTGQPLSPVREKTYNWGTLHRMRITDDTTVEEMCGLLTEDARVRICEPNYIVHFAEAPYVPNDPMWESDADPDDDPRTSVWEQWGPAKLGASLVWNDTKGDENLIVAVLDTGIRFTHEDLHDNIWINEDEIPDDGIDNDDNGWIDDWWGWNTWENNNIPFDLDESNVYHGTGCAGVIAGVQDNGIGVSGIAPNVRLMAIRADCGILLASAVDCVVEGWDYAKTNGADIVSMSFYVEPPSEVLETAAFDTWDNGNGPMLIAAAGNNNDMEVKYPAGYECVMAVAAAIPFTKDGVPHDELRITNTWGGWGWGSSYGGHLSIAGYGERYYSTYGSGDDQYWDGVNHWFFNGTSCACPTVSGCMALLLSSHPGHDGYWYRQRAELTADDLHEPGYDIQTGNGRINVFRAVYGSDRFTDIEDQNGFADLGSISGGIEIYDSIHDVSPDNPFADTTDLYRFTAESDGCIEIYLDIYTWGEDLDMTLYRNPWFSQVFAESTGENHADSSNESIMIYVHEGETFFLEVNSPALGNSTTYGLKINYLPNELSLEPVDIAPASVSAGEVDVPLLKLTFDVSCSAYLRELILNKHSTSPDGLFGSIDLYSDTDGSGDFTPSDELVASDPDPDFNRTRFGNMSIEFSNGNPLTIFVVADIAPSLDPGTEIYVSLETYRDLTLIQTGTEYTGFPVSSGVMLVE